MSRVLHMGLVVRDAIDMPKRRLAKLVGDGRGGFLPAAQAREWLLDRLQEGKRVLPIGEPCEGFSYETGCPGHEEP